MKGDAKKKTYSIKVSTYLCILATKWKTKILLNFSEIPPFLPPRKHGLWGSSGDDVFILLWLSLTGKPLQIHALSFPTLHCAQEVDLKGLCQPAPLPSGCWLIWPMEGTSRQATQEERGHCPYSSSSPASCGLAVIIFFPLVALSYSYRSHRVQGRALSLCPFGQGWKWLCTFSSPQDFSISPAPIAFS